MRDDEDRTIPVREIHDRGLGLTDESRGLLHGL
jgi:hypothetical protein